MSTMKFSDLWRFIYDVLETADDDYCAFYETYWSLPEGNVIEPLLQGKKKYSLSDVMNINSMMIRKNYLKILFIKNGEYEETEDMNIVFDKQKYIPFSRLSGSGVFLVTKSKGSRLRKKIYTLRRSQIQRRDNSE